MNRFHGYLLFLFADYKLLYLRNCILIIISDCQAIRLNLLKRYIIICRQASCIMVGGWCFAIVMALLPILGVSNYSKSAICLPMDVGTSVGLGYVSSLLLVNAAAFFIMCWCYCDMYTKVRGNETGAGQNDVTIAKRMAVLVFTDFVCLFPIAFFGLTTAFGVQLITVSESKILLVFFFPLNSCCNPFLYVIFTKQFKKDFFEILGRFGICEKRAAKYRMPYIYTSNPNSLSQSRSSSQHQLGHRIQRSTDSACLQRHSYLPDNPVTTHKTHNYFPPSTPNNTDADPSYRNSSSNQMTSTAVGDKDAVTTVVAVETTARKLSIVAESSSDPEETHHNSEEKRKDSTGRRKSDVPVHKTVRSISQYNTGHLLDRYGGSVGNGIPQIIKERKESQSTVVTLLSVLSSTTIDTTVDTSVDEPSEYCTDSNEAVHKIGGVTQLKLH